MERSIAKARLIENRLTAVVAFCLTGIVMALSFREVARHAQHKSHWFLDLRSILPAPAAAVVEVGFCLYLFWLGLVFYRVARGKERILVAGWIGALFLGSIQRLVSTSAAAAMDWVKAACMLLALLAAVDILLKTFASNRAGLNDHPDRC
jgi:hypothetical protein